MSKALCVPPIYNRIVSMFPPCCYCFGYGSGVLQQAGPVNKSKNTIDLIFTVDNAFRWHQENIKRNPSHYSGIRLFGPEFISNFQENWGAKIYFNTLIPFENVIIKYGVISQKDLVTDLLDWNDLYIAGRLHKPVETIYPDSDYTVLSAIQVNLNSAIHSSLLLLPDKFSEMDLYMKIAELSYIGDFRMIFGEDKDKVKKIVSPQLRSFKELYSPILKSLHDYIDIPKSCNNAMCTQDVSPHARFHHLSHLPKTPMELIVKQWNKGNSNFRQDTDDVLRAMAFSPECSVIVDSCISDIVWKSSISQSLKGILTAGPVKSVRYSAKKIKKMFQSRITIE